MLTSLDGLPVYLACGATDMRKSIDGLSAIVSQTFELDPFSSSLFVFCNKSRDKLKILFWDHNGADRSAPQRLRVQDTSRMARRTEGPASVKRSSVLLAKSSSV